MNRRPVEKTRAAYCIDGDVATGSPKSSAVPNQTKPVSGRSDTDNSIARMDSSSCGSMYVLLDWKPIPRKAKNMYTILETNP